MVSLSMVCVVGLPGSPFDSSWYISLLQAGNFPALLASGLRAAIYLSQPVLETTVFEIAVRSN